MFSCVFVFLVVVVYVNGAGEHLDESRSVFEMVFSFLISMAFLRRFRIVNH